MKLTAVILLVGCLQVSAKVHSQKITLSEKNATLKKVFHEIEQQSGYQFFFSDNDLKLANTVTIEVNDAEFIAVLQQCFRDQPLSFEIVEKTVVVKIKSATFITIKDDLSPPPPIDITGRITNSSGEPLGGANIIIKRTHYGTTADADGRFTLKNVNAGDVLIVSYVGYKTQNIKVGGITNLTLVMEIATNDLDKVVIQAYGTTTQRLNTGNIATVTAAEIERQPVMNPLIALEGKVPGVIVTPTSGYSSAPIKIEIRGRSVIDGGQPSEPLYIIDGVPLTVLNLSGSNYANGSAGFTQGNQGPAGGQSPLFSINPQDIETITVLKDADATAIYGSRGANGVIIITTKTGKSGKTKLDMNTYSGVNVVTGRYQLMNTQQYLSMRREAFKNDLATYGLIPGVTMPDAGNAYDLLTWDTTRYTDWQKTYWDGTGHETDINLSLSGGDKQNTFRIGSSYHKETTIMSRSGADQRASVQFNYGHKSLNQRLSLSLTSIYSYTQSSLISVGGNVLEAPNAPEIFNSGGSLNWQGWQPVPYSLTNWSSLLQPYVAKTGFLNSRLSLQYHILDGLIFSTEAGYSTAHGSNTSLIPIISQYPRSNPKGQSTFSNTNIANAIVEPQLEYKGIIGGKGKLNILAGGSMQSIGSDANTEIGTGYVNDNLLGSVNNAPSKYASNASAQYKYEAVFARVNYNWADKYLVNLSGRRDGSSRFGPGKQFGNFWAVGAAWIFTEENWLKRHLPVLSFGKLRGSYGLTGNDQIGDYGYLTQWSAGASIPYQGNPGYVPQGHANPNLEWETNYKLEGALDLGFFKDRLTAEIAMYRNRCGNQLVSYPLPVITGFGSIFANSPAVIQNEGLEIISRGKIIDNRDFNWSANFNIGMNHNKLLAFPNFAQSPYVSIYTIGQSLSDVHLLHYIGVDPETGQYTFQDKNHDGLITNPYNKGHNDLFNKDLAVKFDGGFGTDLRYKGWQINLYFQMRSRQIPAAIYSGVPPGNTETNQSIQALDRWQKPGDHAQFARFTTQIQQSDQLFGASDGVYSDGSYFRLRNASLSYDFNERWVKKVGLQKCIIYARGQNLFKLTRYNGVDPDVPGLGVLPPAKVFTMGIQFIF